MRVAEIGTEGDKVPSDGFSVMWALFQRTNGGRMGHIMYAGPSLTGFTPQPY
jgi:hypothetical protein